MKRLEALEELYKQGFKYLTRDSGGTYKNHLTAFKGYPTLTSTGVWKEKFFGFKVVQEYNELFPDVQNEHFLDIYEDIQHCKEVEPMRNYLVKTFISNGCKWLTRDRDGSLAVWSKLPEKTDTFCEWENEEDENSYSLPSYLSECFVDVQWNADKPLCLYNDNRGLDHNKWLNDVPIGARVYVSTLPDKKYAGKGHYAGYDPLTPEAPFTTFVDGKSDWTSEETTPKVHWAYCWLPEEVEDE